MYLKSWAIFNLKNSLITIDYCQYQKYERLKKWDSIMMIAKNNIIIIYYNNLIILKLSPVNMAYQQIAGHIAWQYLVAGHSVCLYFAMSLDAKHSIYTLYHICITGTLHRGSWARRLSTWCSKEGVRVMWLSSGIPAHTLTRWWYRIRYGNSAHLQNQRGVPRQNHEHILSCAIPQGVYSFPMQFIHTASRHFIPE